MTSLLKAPPPSPHQKALCKALGIPDESEDEEEVPNLLHWGGWTGEGGQEQQMLPEELRKRCETRQAARRMVEQFCHSMGKSCVDWSVSGEHRGSKKAVLVCPFRHHADNDKSKKRMEEESQSAEAREENMSTRILEILCPFHVVVRQRQVGGKWFWEVDENGCQPFHNAEQCPSRHVSPSWMIDDHPLFLEEMMKPAKSRHPRRKMIETLASGEGNNQRIMVTVKQLQNAEERYKNAGPGAGRSGGGPKCRRPHWR
jgi:hypothetical protein